MVNIEKAKGKSRKIADTVLKVYLKLEEGDSSKLLGNINSAGLL